MVLVPSFLMLFCRDWYYSYHRSAYELVVTDTLASVTVAFLGAFTAAVVAKIFGIVVNNANLMKTESEKELEPIRIFPL
jgi:ABC-type phosphate/phosphonate transport system permease subunit